MQFHAASRAVNLREYSFQTPLVIPSFSSRAKPRTPVSEFLTETLASIAGPILVSAYDVAHQPPSRSIEVLDAITLASPSFVLLDSGGYEDIWNQNAVKAGLIRENSAPEWALDSYCAVLDRWPVDVPLLAASFDAKEVDAPAIPLDRQIEAANRLADRYPKYDIELLLKPTLDGWDFDSLNALAPDIGRFPAVGITEVEIGASMAERLTFIATLRECLLKRDVDIPIHVFGGLDPQMTPLYHAAGADIFDGLSWLRYAFEGGVGIYDKSFVALQNPLALEVDELWNMRRRNVGKLIDLQIEMTRFQTERNFDVYLGRGDRLRRAWDECSR